MATSSRVKKKEKRLLEKKIRVEKRVKKIRAIRKSMLLLKKNCFRRWLLKMKRRERKLR
jgi:hypothetical protein